MDWLKADEALFFAMVWCVATLVSLFLSLSADSDKSLRITFFSCGVSGFLAFTVVSFLVGRDPSSIAGHWYYLGLSALVGLAGPQQKRIVEALLKKTTLLDTIDDS